MLIDTHCHIDCDAFDSDRDAVIKNAFALGVEKILMIGVRASDWDKKLSLAKQYPQQLYPILGCHPLFINDHSFADMGTLVNHCENKAVTAIGEIGLDYYKNKRHPSPPDKLVQQAYFEKQLRIAEAYRLPVILHVRKAHDEVISTLKKYNIVSGIAHAFNGSVNHAKQYIDLNFKLGVGGMIMRPQSNKLRALFATIPMESIVLETDAPDLAIFPETHKRNSPEFLPAVCDFVAQLKAIDKMLVSHITTQNAKDTIF